MPDNIQWLFFDMGYTLINEDEAHRNRINECILYQLNHYGKLFTYEQIYKEMCLASSEYHQPFYGAMNSLGIKDKTPYPKEFEKPYPQAEHILKELSKKYSIGIIANQSAGGEKRLAAYGWDKYIALFILSAESGLEKPNLNIFKLALSKSCCSAQNSVMIGDRLDNDIYPAKKIGIHTIHIKQGFGRYQTPKSKDYEADITVNDLNELLKYL